MTDRLIPFDKTDLAQLQQVREELRNRWRASAWQLLCRTIDDLEGRAAVSCKGTGAVRAEGEPPPSPEQKGSEQ